MREGIIFCLCFALAFQPWLGQLAYSQSCRRQRSECRYDENGRQTKSWYYWQDANDAGNNATITTISIYDDAGRVVETRRVVDGNGAVTDANVLLSQTQYNTIARPDVVINQHGALTKYEYDHLGNVVETKTYVSEAAYEANEANYLTIAETLYDEFARPIVTADTHTAGATNVPGTETIYDALGRVIQTKRWADVAIPIVDILDDSNNVIGRTNTLTDNNDPNWSRGSLLTVSKSYYNKAGRLWKSESQDENGDYQPTRYEYDGAGRQTAVIDALNHRTEYGYLGNRRTSITDALGHITQFKHDDLGRVVRTIYDDQTFTRRVYDELGRISASNDQTGRTRGFEYKRDEWSSAVVLPAVANPEDGNNLAHPRYEYTCDKYGNMTAQTDKLIQDPNTGDVDANYARTTYFTYDYLGNQLTRKLPNGKVEYKEYNALGQLTKATDFKGQITRFYYSDANAPGQLSQQRFYHDYTVDVDAPNLIIDVIHDKLGRRMRVDVNDVDNGTLGKWRWWYDDHGRATMLESPQGYVGYEYHANTGRRKSVRTPADSNDTKLCYYYDQLGRLSEVNVAKRNNVPVNESTYYGYNDVGSLGIVDYNNGNLAEYSYDTLNRLTNLTNWQTSARVTALSSYTYELAPDGQRTKATELTQGAETVVDWEYDDLNRLIHEDYNAPGDVNDYGHGYVYDLVGNRLARNVTGDDPNTVYYYNDNDQLTLEYTDANTHYTYDDNGSLIEEANDSATLRTYSYDLRQRLSQVDIESGATVDYVYNPDGMRVRATVDGNDIDYIIDPYNHTGYAQVFKEINGVTGDNTVYVTGHDVLAQAVGTANPSYLLYDGHGSVRQLADNVGSVTANYHYDGYGQALNFDPATAATSMLYAGEMIDIQTGWYNNRSRWYNPANGRFNRMDEFPGSNQDPQSLQKYLYCHANPVNGLDPSGEIFGSTSVAGLLTAVGIALIVVAIALPIAGYAQNYLKTKGAKPIPPGTPAYRSVEIALSFLQDAVRIANAGVQQTDVDGLRQLLMVSRIFDYPRAGSELGRSCLGNIYLSIDSVIESGIIFHYLPAADNSVGKTNYTISDYPDGIGFWSVYRLASTLLHEWQHHHYGVSGWRETNAGSRTWKRTYGKEVQLGTGVVAYLKGLPEGSVREQRRKIRTINDVITSARNPR